MLPIAIVASALCAPVSTAQPLVQLSAQNARVLADSAEIAKRARNLQASFERRRRQMLPRFYIGTADHCLIVGRFCEWHPNLKDYVVPDEGEDIVRARAQLLRDLERASDALPGDDWIIGQRIRYLVEGHDTSAVSVAHTCRATKWWCDALLGLSLHVQGDFAGADSAFALALQAMPTPMRCHWNNLSPLLDDDVRGTYHKMSCAQREAADARIWWVADPLFMTPGNERRTEHFSRVLHTLLQQNAVNTYGSSWGGDLAELVLRFGWAEKWTQEPSHSMYMESQPAITGHEREPGYHFFLTQRPPDILALIVDSVFDIYQFPPREQYAPMYTRGFVRLDAQVARFRRGDSTRVVAAFDVSNDTIFGKSKFAAATERAHGGTEFRRNTRIGLFWELYGKTPTDSALPISLTIMPIDEGLLRRTFRALHIAPKLTPLSLRWQENGAAGVMSPRSILLDLSMVPAGKYSVRLEVGDDPKAVSSRIIDVK